MATYYCCVEGCTSRNIKARSSIGISFHNIPVKENVRAEWLRVLFKHNPSFVVTDRSTVCSLHFTPSDYKHNSKKRNLLPNASPSIFPRYPTCFELPTKQNRSATETLHALPNIKAGCSSSETVDYHANQSHQNHAETTVDIHFTSAGYTRSVGAQVSLLPTGQLEALRKENLALRVQHYKLNETLKSITGKVATIKVRYDNAIAYHKFKRLKSTLTPNASNTPKAKYLFEQIENHNKVQPHWCESTVKECADWRLEAPKSFQYARSKEILTLPSRHTLERYIQNLDPETALKYKKTPKVEEAVHTILISQDQAQIIRNTPKVLQNTRSLNIPCRKKVNRNLLRAFVITNILDSSNCITGSIVTSMADASDLYRTPLNIPCDSVESVFSTQTPLNNVLQVEIPPTDDNV